MPAQCCIDSWNKIPADEPVFVIRGKDLLAAKTVSFWLELAARSGVNEEKLRKSHEHFQAIVKFHLEHPERCKIPD